MNRKVREIETRRAFRAYSDDQPRDEGGRFGEGSGGKAGDASKSAHEASKKAWSPKPHPRAPDPSKSGAENDERKAKDAAKAATQKAKEHDDAAKAHRDAAEAHSKGGDASAKDKHEAEASKHENAARAEKHEAKIQKQIAKHAAGVKGTIYDTPPKKKSMSARVVNHEPRPFRATATPGEALCIDPGAGGMIAAAIRGAPPSPNAFSFMHETRGPLTFDPEGIEEGVATLCLSGPIEHHAGYWCHSYEALACEVECAMQHGEVRAVVLKIDSPGGVAAGMGETHKALRHLSRLYGKPLYGFADEMACSAAYHLISACREVWTTEAGHVGSIGVILCTIDETKRLEKEGVAVRYLVTGSRKADLHPGTAVTSDVVSVAQAKVDKLGRQFFRRVARSRGQAPGGGPLATPEAVKALQAAVYVGNDAVAVGLADGVASWREFMGYVKAAIGRPTDAKA